MNKFYMFGAHSRGKTAAYYLCYLNSGMNVEAYLYDNDEKNEQYVDDVPVVFVNEDTKLHTDYPVYIGTKSMFHSSIIEKLKKIGMKDIRPITVDLDLQLRNEYLEKYYRIIGRDLVKIDNLNIDIDVLSTECEVKSCVYVSKSVYDKTLNDDYILQDYEQEIQAGAELTSQRLAENIITDNTGDNISNRNRQFCELTVLYWIWKNSIDDVVGLVHYRRHFMLPSDWKIRMLQHQIDVILPTPLYVVPNLEMNYRSRHDERDLDYLFLYLKETNIEDYIGIKDFFQGGIYSPCNMLIARKEVLNDLCEWLFPILFAVAEHGKEKEDVYLNRYPGFISERLISYFFEKNREKYKIAYSNKNFLR